MQFSLAIAASVLASTASAVITGTNQNGSIFMFGNPAPARSLLYNYGACGLSTYFPGKVPASMPLVAMPAGVFDKYGSAQHNTLCGKIITISRNGVTRQAAIADRNLSADNSIDMTLDLWQAFGGHDNDGSLIRGFSWSIAN